MTPATQFQPPSNEVVTPRDEILAAANMLAVLVSGALGSDGVWCFSGMTRLPGVRTPSGQEIAYGDHVGSLRYVAAMGPLVGAALEKTLRLEWDAMESLDPESQADYAGPLLEVARALRGTRPAPRPPLRAPWSPEQVEALNEFQRAGGMHPFTCGGEHKSYHRILVATEAGWGCPDRGCDYTQDWAHWYMAEPDKWPAIRFPYRAPAGDQEPS